MWTERTAALMPDLDRNARIVVAARALRSFGFGLSSVALGLYLAGMGPVRRPSDQTERGFVAFTIALYMPATTL